MLEEFLKLAREHYWDTLEPHKELIIKHVESIAEMVSRPTPDAADLLPAPACCASFVTYGVHHKDCRFAQSASG